MMPAGTVMGHELGGEVVAVGAGAGDGWKEGMRAAVLPVHACGECDRCRAGNVAHCEHAQLVGLGGAPGGFAELARVSADARVPVARRAAGDRPRRSSSRSRSASTPPASPRSSPATTSS